MKKIISTNKSSAPIGPYSQAVLGGNTLYVSGQVGMDPLTNNLVKGDVKAETMQAMKNIKAILEAASGKFSNVVKAAIFLKDMNDFAAMNEVYGSFFESEFPARETVEVSRLPRDAKVEISVIAVLD